MNTRILFGKDARAALLAGAEELYLAVASTLGPRGHTVAIDKGYGIPHITKDGVTVARAYDTDDPMKRMGATLVKIVAAKTCDQAGDGTTTATILSYAMMKRGVCGLVNIQNPHEYRRGMEDALDEAVNYIKSSAVKIKPDEIDRIRQVAKVSANGDDMVADLITSAIESVGNDGIITVEESTKGDESTVEVTTGFQWSKGIINPYFVTDSERMECVLDRPYVLIWGQNINYVQEILAVVQTVYTAKRSLLIVAPNASNDVIKFLVTNVQQNNGLKACFVKAPGFGQMQKDLMQDLAVKVGGRIVGEEYGNAIESFGTDWLGEVDKATISANRTVLVGGAGKPVDIDARIEFIKNEMAENSNTYDREKYRERISRLTGGAAVIYVGADSEVEMKERKDRVDDAIAATRAALDEGYVPGGGTIQYKIAKILERSLNDNPEWSTDYSEGYRTVIEALKKHFHILCQNAGVEPIRIEIMMDLKSTAFQQGYNPFTDKIEDMYKAGVIDPAKVTRTSLENAVSVAVQFLGMSCAMSGEEAKK